jgi:hypothetical protein
MKQLKNYLIKVKKYYNTRYEKATKSKDDWFGKFQASDKGREELALLKNSNHNTKMEELVKNIASDLEEVIEEDGRLVATNDPIFRDGHKEHFIRSHFFAPQKHVFGKFYNTFSVNILVIWGMSLVLWITLYFDALRKLLRVFETVAGKFKKPRR